MTNTKARHGIRYDNGPVVAVNVGGSAAAWCDGVFTAARDHLADIELAINRGTVVRVGRRNIISGRDTPVQALAAMSAWSPGRVAISTAPDEVWEVLDADTCGDFIEDVQDFDDSPSDNSGIRGDF